MTKWEKLKRPTSISFFGKDNQYLGNKLFAHSIPTPTEEDLMDFAEDFSRQSKQEVKFVRLGYADIF